jgi:hypothetical protein
VTLCEPFVRARANSRLDKSTLSISSDGIQKFAAG